MKNFSKIIIWGHKIPHSHTHFYIHSYLFKAFKYLDYPVYWLDNNDDISNLSFDNSLFITEFQVEEKIPVLKNCKYISYVTSIEPRFVSHSYEPNLNIDVYKYKTIQNLNKVNEYTYVSSDKHILIQPWATNLLPHEFDFESIFAPRNQEAYFFGTVVTAGWNNNQDEINKFEKTCLEKDIKFDYRGLYTKGFVDDDRCVQLLKQAYAAPSIQGVEQIESGYIPCRIFKNTSCGQYCLTNSKAVFDVFKDTIPELIFIEPEYMLERLCQLYAADINKSILIDQMKYIQAHHTYVNRINEMLNLL